MRRGGAARTPAVGKSSAVTSDAIPAFEESPISAPHDIGNWYDTRMTRSLCNWDWVISLSSNHLSTRSTRMRRSERQRTWTDRPTSDGLTGVEVRAEPGGLPEPPRRCGTANPRCQASGRSQVPLRRTPKWLRAGRSLVAAGDQRCCRHPLWHCDVHRTGGESFCARSSVRRLALLRHGWP
jgi:hypothetical protein